jgi:hypothetical protein
MKRWFVVFSLVIAGIGAAGWVCRNDLKARYYAHKLLTVADADVAAWVDQAGAWGDGVPERLVVCLTADDAGGCARVGAALARLQNPTITARLGERFSRLSLPGQQAAIDCVFTLAPGQQPEVVAACKQIVRPAILSPDAGVRLRAAALAMRPEIGQAELLVPLLKDPDAEIRRAAMSAVGPSRALIADDDLLGWLHDPDATVRKLTEAALRNRGLRAVDVQMGRLLTDPRPAARLELLTHLQDDVDLDLSAWLRRLSEDPVPAVRAAAARLADERQVYQLTDRLTVMAKSDPDLTVRQAVLYHLGRLQSPVRPVSAP